MIAGKIGWVWERARIRCQGNQVTFAQNDKPLLAPAGAVIQVIPDSEWTLLPGAFAILTEIYVRLDKRV
jgi:hypothetical protein